MFRSIGKLRVTYDPSQTYAICKKCKYFKNGINDDAELGFCMRFSEINVVSGEISYTYASVARAYECDGKYYAPRIGLNKNKIINDNGN